MHKNTCPRCQAEIVNTVLYQCVRCFTVYCKECNDTEGGRLCPQCRMSQRMVVTKNK